jgi:hypothetical protein
MFKKAMVPILVLVGVILVLAGVAYWYSQKESENWPFKSERYH